MISVIFISKCYSSDRMLFISFLKHRVHNRALSMVLLPCRSNVPIRQRHRPIKTQAAAQGNGDDFHGPLRKCVSQPTWHDFHHGLVGSYYNNTKEFTVSYK